VVRGRSLPNVIYVIIPASSTQSPLRLSVCTMLIVFLLCSLRRPMHAAEYIIGRGWTALGSRSPRRLHVWLCLGTEVGGMMTEAPSIM
jgi:hypothetical protein